MKRVLILALMAAMTCFGVVACQDSSGDQDGGGGGNGNDAAAGDADTDADGDADTDTDAAVDAGSYYPPPPYGIYADNTVENMKFATLPCKCVDKCDDALARNHKIECGEGEMWSFEDFYKSEDKILIMYVGAGW